MEAQLRSILQQQPDYLPAWQGLGQICLEQGRLEEVAEAARRLRSAPETQAEGWLLLARMRLAEGDRSAVREALKSGLRASPSDLRLRNLLSSLA